MKRWAIISVIFITIFAIFIGCQRRESTKEEVYKEFQKKIVTMSSYKCIAEIEASGNKSSHNYVFIHSYVKPDYYKLEVVEPKNLKGKTMEYKGDKVIISNPDIKDKIELPNMEDNRQYAFFPSSSEKVKISKLQSFVRGVRKSTTSPSTFPAQAAL